jgi:micrococcal nuclease
MMGTQKLFDRLTASGLWAICSIVLFIVMATRGYSLAALLIAGSGLSATPEFRDTFRRYGADDSRRFKLSVGLAAASCAAILVLPSTKTIANEGTEPSKVYAVSSARQTMPLETVSGCVAVDGDTLDCMGEKIRLLGIDAPEMPGHCRDGRACVQGDPFAATANLQSALAPSLAIERVGQDRYGRTLAMVFNESSSLSCMQLRHGHALYRPEWDDGGRLASDCPTNPG